MALTNREFARYTALVARRAAAWNHDTLSMGDQRWNAPTINSSPERFCRDIEEVLGWIRAEAEQAA